MCGCSYIIRELIDTEVSYTKELSDILQVMLLTYVNFYTFLVFVLSACAIQ